MTETAGWMADCCRPWDLRRRVRRRRAPDPLVIALAGGGGKTTSMGVLAREVAGWGRRVLVTTSTHIGPAGDGENPGVEAENRAAGDLGTGGGGRRRGKAGAGRGG